MTTTDQPWTERSAELYEFFFSREDAHLGAERLHALIQERSPKAHSLLDVACGTGWHLERLMDWYEVEGLDLSPGMLRFARERLPGVPLHESNMRSFKLGRTFDVVTCLSSSILWMRTRDDLFQAVATMSQHLSVGGLLIIEPWDFPGDSRPETPWLATTETPDRIVTLMETTTLEADSWLQETHYLDWRRSSPIEHWVERHTLGAFDRSDFAVVFDELHLDAEFDLEGLLGRGLFICKPL